jgi:hypothetical protein
MSASANNEIAYVDTHDSFAEEIHVTRMTEVEAATFFHNHPALAEGVNLQAALDAAGAVPFYMKKFLDDHKSFQRNINFEVDACIRTLKKDPEGRWPLQMESIIFSVLESPAPFRLYSYDHKYLTPVREGSSQEHMCLYEPLFPAVLQAYRTSLWDEIMKYMGQQEFKLMNLLSSCLFHNDVVGRLIELLVIQRIEAKGMTMKWRRQKFVFLPGEFHLFSSQSLPAWPNTNGLWVPENADFPAIDFFVKSDSTVFAFQAHISTHRNVTPKFCAMCKGAGWFTATSRTAKKRAVVLVYLSPNDEAKKLLDSLVKEGFYPTEPAEPGSGSKRPRDQTAKQGVHLLSLTCNEIIGLESLTFDM